MQVLKRYIPVDQKTRQSSSLSILQIDDITHRQEASKNSLQKRPESACAVGCQTSLVVACTPPGGRKMQGDARRDNNTESRYAGAQGR
ncbi:hypothetical protein C0Q70_08213 [Pomacea canaliculata]|uniref:Uncharacterized protein n=1 Tax=Pomacea canaliculata TaxID=400727 RepID=A0A2T7PH86_POMCA|nr:hypothetical protein C0Q70_08213 [Pomacea canaliculata]